MPDDDASARWDTPERALRTFLAALKTHDMAAAKKCLTNRSVAEGDPNLPEMPEDAPFNYTLAEPQPIDTGVVIEAHFDPPIPDTPPAMKFALMQEDGAWKIDLPQTFEQSFGMNPEQLMEQMTSQIGDTMQQVANAMAEGIGRAFESVGLVGSPEERPAPDEPPYPEDFTQYYADLMHDIDGKLSAVSQQLREAADVELEIGVGWRSFLDGSDEQEARQTVQQMDENLVCNLWYVLREVNEKVPLANRLKRLRFVQVDSASKRAIFADGATVVCRVNLRDRAGWYGVDDLVQILSGVVAGIPEYSGDDERFSPEPHPDATAGQILDDYQERVADRLVERLRGQLQAYVPVNADWSLLRSELGERPDAMRNLYYWGLNRIVGGFALLARDELARDILKREHLDVRLKFVDQPELRAATCRLGSLQVALCLSAGEQGCFYEHEIAKALEDGLRIKIRPIAETLTDQFWSWANRLSEMVGRGIDFQWDLPGFTSHPDMNRNLFALTLLREQGIDALGYAVHGLIEKNPNFKQQFACRVNMLRVEHAPSPDEKRVVANGSALEYYCYLHEGYDGYLTIQEIQQRLPQIVADMPDLPLAEEPALPSADAQPVEVDDAAPAAADVPGPADQNRAGFEEIVRNIQSTLGSYAQTFAAIVGKPIELDIDWESLEGDPNAPWMLLNTCLGGVIGGIAQLGGDPGVAQRIRDCVDLIVLTRAASKRQARITLEGRTLLVAAVTSTGAQPLDAAATAGTIGRLLSGTREAGA
jgi:hypothetical protein